MWPGLIGSEFGVFRRLEGGFDEQVRRLCEDGRVRDALDAIEVMEERGVIVSFGTYGCLLQSCLKRKELAEAHRVHLLLCKNGHERDGHLGNTLVNVLVQCGSLSEAVKVFDRLPYRNVYSWTALISGYNRQGQPREALKLYQHMRNEGVKRNKYTFVSVLKACHAAKDLEEGRRIHAEAISCGLESDLYIGTTLVDMYSSLGDIEDARNVFDVLPEHDVASWNAIIIGCAEQEHGEMALQLYEQMQEEGFDPDNRTLVSVLKACGNLASKEEEVKIEGQRLKMRTLQQGKILHGWVVRCGYGSDAYIGNGLVDMYAKCGDLLLAQLLLDMLPHRNVVSWNAMIAGCTQQEQGWRALALYERMQEEDVQPTERTFVSVLKACSSLAASEPFTRVDGKLVKTNTLRLGSLIHAESTRGGHTADPFVCNTLVDMYAKCGDMTKARQLIDELNQRDVVSWTAMITGYAQQGQGGEALQLYTQLVQEGDVEPNDRTFVSVLNACGCLPEMETSEDFDGKAYMLQQVRAVHAEVVRRGYQFDVFVGNSLVDMYSKCGDLLAAQLVFNSLPNPNVVSWSALITGYAQQENSEQAFHIYAQMQEKGVQPNDRTLIGVLKACANLAAMEEGASLSGEALKINSLGNCRKIHADVVRLGYGSSLFVCNTLIDTYAKCGSLPEAAQVFDNMTCRDVVTWNTVIAAYAQEEKGEKGMKLYVAMLEQGFLPNEATFLGILRACSNTGGLQMCRHIHEEILNIGIEWSSSLATSVIHAYGKCGSMADAHQVFSTLVQPDVWQWTALIAGYARQGQWRMCIRCYEQMQDAGIRPKGVTFVSLLAACSHAGLVYEGLVYFESMIKEHHITADLPHYASMVDLLSRAGLLQEAESMIASMPMQPSLPVWLGFLGACRTHSNPELGRRAFERAIQLDPKHSSPYLLMSNIYQEAGMWEAAREVVQLSGGACVWKKPGRSWIDDGKSVHVFHAAEETHGHSRDVYAWLKVVNSEMDK